MEYCISIDRVPLTFYDEIIQNKAQINEWNHLFNLDLNQDTLNPTYFKKRPYFPVDTKYFSDEFTQTLLSELMIDGIIPVEGIIINGNNLEVDDGRCCKFI